MKKLQVSARIIRVSPVTSADGSPVFRNGRHITHRAILAPSQSFEKAIKEVALLKRLPEGDGTTRTATFCLKRNDGLYAIDLNENQMQLLTGGRVSPQQFQFIAPNCTFNATVELRALGDMITDQRTGDQIEIGKNHGKNGNPSNAHAAISDLSSTIPPQTESAIIHAMFSTATPMVSTVAVPMSVSQASVEVVETTTTDESDLNISAPTAETPEVATEEKP